MESQYTAKYLTEFDEGAFELVETKEKFCDVVSYALAEQPILGVDVECSDASYEGFICFV